MRNTFFNHASIITGFWHRIGSSGYSTPAGSLYIDRILVIHVNPLQGFLTDLQTIIPINPFQGFVAVFRTVINIYPLRGLVDNCLELLHGIQGIISKAIPKGLNINRIINKQVHHPEGVEYEPTMGYL